MADPAIPHPHRLYGEAPRSRQVNRRLEASLEMAVQLHLGTLAVVTAWWFGGQSPGARDWLLGWGSLGITLFFISLTILEAYQPKIRRQTLGLLWPLLLFNLFVVASCFNPILRPVLREGERYLMLVDAPHAWLPVCARPADTLRQLWLLDGIILSCFNAYLVLRSRRQLRQLLLLFSSNALALAVFGTFQKLLGANGLYFGLVPSPQIYFFSTFVYHNHWGAFILLHLAIGLGLLFRSLRQPQHRDVWHSPAPFAAVAILLLAATLPLSGSRSSTALACLLVGGALVHFLRRTIRHRREHHEAALFPVVGIIAAIVVSAGAILFLSRDVIAQRAELTATQLAHIRHEDRLNSRLTLYRDTWQMATDRPWTGWGLDSYGDIFRIYNTQRAFEAHLGQPYYRRAHNDWLQSLAETGLIGTCLLLLTGLLPVLGASWRQQSTALPHYLLAGCGLILLYALVEFPLANPSVLIAFWSGLFIAVRYARLDHTA
jgi:O-antigen ligase